VLTGSAVASLGLLRHSAGGLHGVTVSVASALAMLGKGSGIGCGMYT
jgi:hypothetical protein